MCCCAGLLCLRSARRTTSFTESLSDKDPQDYDHDALVVHMGESGTGNCLQLVAG
jgi:hypothetical protein